MVRRGGALLHAAMLCATLSASTPALRAGTLASRRTVCPNSFNGSEEVDVFRTFLPPDEFDYVDLAPPAFFIVGGIFRIATALSFRFPGRAWAVAGGTVTVALGVIIAAEWPVSAVWVIGTFVGIDLILDG